MFWMHGLAVVCCGPMCFVLWSHVYRLHCGPIYMCWIHCVCVLWSHMFWMHGLVVVCCGPMCLVLWSHVFWMYGLVVVCCGPMCLECNFHCIVWSFACWMFVFLFVRAFCLWVCFPAKMAVGFFLPFCWHVLCPFSICLFPPPSPSCSFSLSLSLSLPSVWVFFLYLCTQIFSRVVVVDIYSLFYYQWIHWLYLIIDSFTYHVYFMIDSFVYCICTLFLARIACASLMIDFYLRTSCVVWQQKQKKIYTNLVSRIWYFFNASCLSSIVFLCISFISIFVWLGILSFVLLFCFCVCMLCVIYIYTYVHICIWIYMHTHTQTHRYTYVYIHTHVCCVLFMYAVFVSAYEDERLRTCVCTDWS